MNILHVTPFFYPAWAYGGIPRIIHGLCRELVRQGNKVTVYTTDVLDAHSRNTPPERCVDVEGIRTHYFNNVSNLLAYHYNIYLPRGMRRHVKRELAEFDIIQMTGHRNFLNNITHFYSTKFDVPYVFCGEGTVLRQERRVFAKQLFDIMLGDRILKDARHFIAVSDNEVNEFERMGVERSRISVIPNGIDAEAFRDLPGPGLFREKYGVGDMKMVFFIGRIAPIKGLGFLVRAFAECARDDSVLVVAGPDMGGRAEVDAFISEKKIARKVIFTGLLEGRDKLSAYVDADVTVNPSVYEVFGLVLFESLLCGTPVIATHTCGSAEIVSEHDFGRVVPYGDVRTLSNRLNEMLNMSPQQKTEMAERGKRHVLENLAWPSVAKKIVGLYERVCEKCGRQ